MAGRVKMRNVQKFAAPAMQHVPHQLNAAETLQALYQQDEWKNATPEVQDLMGKLHAASIRFNNARKQHKERYRKLLDQIIENLNRADYTVTDLGKHFVVSKNTVTLQITLNPRVVTHQRDLERDIARMRLGEGKDDANDDVVPEPESGRYLRAPIESKFG